MEIIGTLHIDDNKTSSIETIFVDTSTEYQKSLQDKELDETDEKVDQISYLESYV